MVALSPKALVTEWTLPRSGLPVSSDFNGYPREWTPTEERLLCLLSRWRIRTVQLSQGRSWRSATVHTVGHSTRTIDEFVALLRAFDISELADIRTIPRSRHNPQFSGDALRSSLRSRGIGYVHVPELGGLRRTRKESPNIGWRNVGFRGFADYMLTADFEAGLAKLNALRTKGGVAIMCAEAVPWRCHRSLVADALVARGAQVEHIATAKRSTPHRMTAFAEVKGARVTYPGEALSDGRLSTRAPFNLEATVRVLQRRPTNAVDVWERERYVRVVLTAEGPALVEVRNDGTIDTADIRMDVLRNNHSAATRSALEGTVRRVLGLDVDPRPIQSLAEGERKLVPMALALRGMRPPRFAGLFEAFANVVPFQQVSLDAGVAVVRRLVERFGQPLDHGGKRFYAFPEAQVIAESRVATIKACGLSLRKAQTIRRAAKAIASGEISEEALSRMESKDALLLLSDLQGIGPWSASVILLRGLGRLDVFPPGDVGATRGLSTLLHVDTDRALERVVQHFGDYRGYLYFYSLGSSLVAKNLIQPAPPSRR